MSEVVDRLIIEGARVTDKGRLDFPDRLPFCYGNCDCIFSRIYLYLRSSGRYEEEETLVIRCNPTKMVDIHFPAIYSPLDDYSKSYYKTKILPIVLRFYDPDFMRELWEKALSKK